MPLTAGRALVKWGYFQAAALEDVVMTADADKTRRHVVAHVVGAANTSYLQQSPLMFVLCSNGREFAWPIESYAINDEDQHGIVFRAIVGIPEGGNHGRLVARPS